MAEGLSGQESAKRFPEQLSSLALIYLLAGGLCIKKGVPEEVGKLHSRTLR